MKVYGVLINCVMSFRTMKNFRRFLIVLSLVFIFFTFFFWLRVIEKEPERVTEDPWVKKHWNHVKIISDPASHSQNQKIILLWTKFFGIADFVPKYSSIGCSSPNCIVTSNRDFLNKSSAVLFHLRDINLNDMPTLRTVSQRWVLLHHESPHHTPDIIKSLDGVFNWTATYRYDSDIILSPMVKKLEKENPKTVNYFQTKNRMVAWLVSNCDTPSKRENYVKELQKVIPVDMYGTCGKFTCLPKMSDECYETLSKMYRFYLAFENSICKDYVTEKFWRILHTNMVPVVLGGANYTQAAPPSSFIDALSFKTPKDLGHFLLQVAKDEQKYNSYFEWRKTHRLEYDKHYVCSLCSLLNKPIIKHTTYFNLTNWWFGDANCRAWSPAMGKG